MIIAEFKTGDIITRVEPAMGFTKDTSYIGDAIEFLRLERGCLIFKNAQSSDEQELHLTRWCVWLAGWEYLTEEILIGLLEKATENKMLGLVEKYTYHLKRFRASKTVEL